MVRNKYYLLLTISVLLASCESMDVPDVMEGKSNPLVIKAVADGTTTRASGSNWDKNDEIGVSVAGSRNYLNVKYTNSSEAGPVGNFEVAGETPVLLKEFETYDLYAYYPFMGNEGKKASIPLDFTDQSKAKAYDIMWAPLTKVDGSNPNLNLELHHQLCKLRIILECDVDMQLRDIALFISGLSMKGTFSIDETGKPNISVGSEKCSNVKVGKSPYEANMWECEDVFDFMKYGPTGNLYGYTVEATILPQTSPITVSWGHWNPKVGNPSTLASSESIEFLGGHLYTLRVMVSGSIVEMNISGCSISGWSYSSSNKTLSD